MIQGLQQANISLDKGIFRTPSMGADGELSECVNLIPHAGELVRIHEPQPLAMEEGANWLSYSCAWYEVNNGYGSFAVKLSQPAPLDLKVTFTLARKDGKEGLTPTLSIGKGSSSASRQVAGFAQYEVVAVKAGDDETDKALKQLGFDGIRAHRPFTASSWDEINGITDWSSAFELPEGYRLLRTHFCAGKENLILSYGKYLVYYRPGEGYTVLLDTLNTSEPFSVDTLGQTLIFSQNGEKAYFLWEKEGYKELNVWELLPKVEFALGDTTKFSISSENFNATGDFPARSYLSHAWIPPKEYGARISLPLLLDSAQFYFSSGDTEKNKQNRALLIDSWWGHYNKRRAEIKEAGAVCFPFFVRYGVELYDGSVINLSAPIIMTPSSRFAPYAGMCIVNGKAPLETSGVNTTGDAEHFSVAPLFCERNFYAAIDASCFEGVNENIISGIVIYATPEIEIVDTSGKEDNLSFSKEKQLYFDRNTLVPDSLGNSFKLVDLPTYNEVEGAFLNYLWSLPVKENLEEDFNKLTDPTEFYELARISISTLKENGYKLYLSPNKKKLNTDAPQETTKFGFLDGAVWEVEDSQAAAFDELGYKFYQIDKSSFLTLPAKKSLASVSAVQKYVEVVNANASYSYNDRLLYGGITTRQNPYVSAYQILADSRTLGLKEQIGAESPKLYLQINDSYLTAEVEPGFLKGFAGQIPFLSVPYDEANAIGFRGNGDSSWSGIANLTRRTDSLGGNAIWTGIHIDWLRKGGDTSLLLIPQAESVPAEWASDSYKKNGAEAKPNAIAVAKVANPWVIEAVYELACGEILALSSATEALSEGQFGEFPVYAFTDNGIYALSVSDTGAIAAKQPISREVLSAPNAVLQLDNAVVFPTKAGLRHLSGRTVTPLSDTINGFNINEALYDTPPELTIADRQPFNEQIQNCRMLYDPANRLIHIFNDLEGDEATPAAVQHRWAESLEPVSTDNGWYMRSYLSRIEIPGGTRQKHYVLDIPSGQWATQILPQKLTACVPGYPFSTMQFGRSLMQYTSELEKDTLRPGWLITRPVSFGDFFARKMLADIRAFGQKTSDGTSFRIRVYTSDDRTHWHPLSSLKSRSAKWYRFLVKADMTGLDTLSGLACQYVQRLGQKLR